jgi:hypothetical protein
VDVPSGLADEVLNSGLINGGGTGHIGVTVNNISYGKYDLYLYVGNDNPRDESVTLGGTTYYVRSGGVQGTPGFVDGNSATPYTYIQATSTNPGSPTNNADYVVFKGLTGNSLTFSVDSGTGFPFLNGFQIVTPEPSSFVLGGLALAGLVAYGWRNRRRSA